MGPYYDHLWRDRQQRIFATERVPARSSRGVRDRVRALVTRARPWLALGEPTARALGLLRRTGERRAGVSRHTLVARSIAYGPYAREAGRCR